MKFRSLVQKFFVFVLCLTAATAAAGQKAAGNELRQEKLLNGLKVLIWSDPSATDVKVSIRVHSGAAFDPQGKEGLMKLLSENILPTPASREFFTEDLGGTLEIITNYDYIQINGTARSSEFLTLLETLAQAVTNPTIDKDNTAALKKSLTEKLAVLEKDPSYIADQAAAKRLFGTFPYGRPSMGSLESLQRIDPTDLVLAKQRFLSADNATVAILGNFNNDLAFRAVRRYFGAWLKSDKRVPATFRQPDAPDTKPVQIAVPGANPPQSSFALRGLARNDPDYFAAAVLEKVLRMRSAKAAPGAAVSHDARMLPGVVTVRYSGSAGFPFSLFTDRISESEFAQARNEAITEFLKRSVIDQWLDADTYRTSPASEASGFQKLSVADVQRAADRLAKNPIVSVVVTPAGATE